MAASNIVLLSGCRLDSESLVLYILANFPQLKVLPMPPLKSAGAAARAASRRRALARPKSALRKKPALKRRAPRTNGASHKPATPRPKPKRKLDAKHTLPSFQIPPPPREARGQSVVAPQIIVDAIKPGEKMGWRVAAIDQNGEPVRLSALTPFTWEPK